MRRGERQRKRGILEREREIGMVCFVKERDKERAKPTK